MKFPILEAENKELGYTFADWLKELSSSSLGKKVIPEAVSQAGPSVTAPLSLSLLWN